MAERGAEHAAKHLDAARRHVGGVPGPLADFGCGEGVFAGASERYVGIDISWEKARDVRNAGRAALVANLGNVPLRDGACAAVLCVNTLHCAGGPVAVLREIDRVLKPGGRAYVKNDWYKSPFGRGQVLRREVSRWGHRLAYLWHVLFAPRRFLVRGTPRGRAVCPHCFRRYFSDRGYAVRRESRYVMLLTKADESAGTAYSARGTAGPQ
jgi:SAM-dependent methyltransferase